MVERCSRISFCLCLPASSPSESEFRSLTEWWVQVLAGFSLRIRIRRTAKWWVHQPEVGPPVGVGRLDQTTRHASKMSEMSEISSSAIKRSFSEVCADIEAHLKMTQEKYKNFCSMERRYGDKWWLSTCEAFIEDETRLIRLSHERIALRPHVYHSTLVTPESVELSLTEELKTQQLYLDMLRANHARFMRQLKGCMARPGEVGK